MKNKFILSSVLLLALFSCQGNNDSSMFSSSSSQSSEKTSTAGKNSTSKVSSSKKDSTSKSSSTSKDDKPSWKEDIQNLMKKYLHDNVVPYAYLGSDRNLEYSYATTEYDYGMVSILGTKAYADTTNTDLATAYLAEGYSEEERSDESILFTKSSDENLHVKFSKTKDGSILLNAYYDEEYSFSSAPNSYDSDMVSEMETIYGETLPYVYLGLSYPSIKTSQVSQSYGRFEATLSGGKWTDQILVDAKETLEGLGYTASVSGSTLSATGKSKISKNSFEITISPSLNGMESYNGPKKKIAMKVKMNESFDDTSLTSWPSRVKTNIDTYLDHHEIPFVYLGTRALQSYYSSTSDTLEIRGKLYQDSILQKAKTAFEGETDPWSVTMDSASKYLKAEKTFSDGCKLTSEISYDTTYSYTKMVIGIERSYTIPEGKTEWSKSTIKEMNTNLGEVLPYLYLNEENDYADWDNEESTLTIIGGIFTSKIFDKALEVYPSSSYTQTRNGNVSLTLVKERSNDTLTISISHANEENTVYYKVKKTNR